jgi:hypothetical protein
MSFLRGERTSFHTVDIHHVTSWSRGGVRVVRARGRKVGGWRRRVTIVGSGGESSSTSFLSMFPESAINSYGEFHHGIQFIRDVVMEKKVFDFIGQSRLELVEQCAFVPVKVGSKLKET